MKITPFIDPTDREDIRELKRRYVRASRFASRGSADEWCAFLAAQIDFVLAWQGEQQLSKRDKAEIKRLRAFLAPALLEAAEHGKLSEVARLLEQRRENGAILNRDWYRVVAAYGILLCLKNRPPFIGELREQIGIDKPQRTPKNEQEW